MHREEAETKAGYSIKKEAGLVLRDTTNRSGWELAEQPHDKKSPNRS